MKNAFLTLAILSLLSAAPATADTINFSPLTPGDLGPGAVTVDGVTFDGTQNLFNTSEFHFTASGGSICAFDPVAFSCANDMTVKFDGKVKRLSLATAGYHDGDSVTISVYRRGRDLGSVTITADQPINLHSFGRVTKLVFDDSSSGNGYTYGLFKFTRLGTVSKQHDGKRAAAKSK